MLQEIESRNDIIEDQFIDFIPQFESFFNRVGFKRVDGAIFGLLCFCKTPLTSVQIENILGLSQSAVSNSLKTLHEYSMIKSYDDKDTKRLKLHCAKEDSLSIVASVLRKREMHYLQEFEKMGTKAQSLLTKDDERSIRLNSILLTTRFAKSLTEIIVKISDEFENPYPIMAKIPQAIEFIKNTVPSIESAKDQLTNTLKNKIGNWLTSSDSQGAKNESL